MKLSALFAVAGVIAIVFGLAFLLVPEQLMSQYGLTGGDATLFYIARLFGAALVGIGLMNWSARNSAASSARGAIVQGNLVADAIGTLVAVMAQLDGVTNALGWSTVAIYALLTLGFAQHQFSKSA